MPNLLPSGPPFALPPALDRAGEWWARRTPRTRTALAGVTTVLAIALVAWPTGSPWGPVATAWVAARPLPVGHTLAPGDLTAVAWPTNLLPEESLLDARTFTDVTLAVGLPTGTPLTAGHLRGPTLADRAPPDTVVVSVPAELLPDAPGGTLVDLHGGEGAAVIGALVLERSPDVVWLAVPRARAGILAEALAWGNVLVGIVSSAG